MKTRMQFIVIVLAAALVWLSLCCRTRSGDTPETATPADTSSARKGSGIEISLRYGNDFLLYILLHSDGTVNRQGAVNESLTAAAPNASRNVYMGQTTSPMVREMMEAVGSELAGCSGSHTLGGSGDTLRLVVSIFIADRLLRIEYFYGSGTSGPPSVVRSFVARAVGLTDAWIREVDAKRAK